MAELKYLYGAAVQGIQSFIYQTNKLKEIVGASELVYKVCTEAFDEFSKPGEAVQRAAGGIKHIFDNREECEKAVLNFPKKVMEMAPGITISQAVVVFKETKTEGKEYDDHRSGYTYLSFKSAVNELEQRLRVQRNHPVRSLTCGLSGMRRSRTTGLPAVRKDGEDYLDIATLKKREEINNANQKLCHNSFGCSNFSSNQLVFDVDKMTGQNDWLAVIHIDGNGLGQIVQAIGTQKDEFKCFSSVLEKITIVSAQLAFAKIKEKHDFRELIPIRPIVLSGDDHTLICRADLAVDYVKAYFKTFEEKTLELKEILKGGDLKFDHLTACAGIAFVKSSFPFYYGYNLAEELCNRAKKDAKREAHLKEGLPQSCLMFHKVQDSFVENYETIVARELTPQEGKTFEFGPYYLNAGIEGCYTIDELMDDVKQLDGKNGNAIKSGLRQWISFLHDNIDIANQKVKRLMDVVGKSDEEFVEKVTTEKLGKILAYDLLVLHSILNQKTK